MSFRFSLTLLPLAIALFIFLAAHVNLQSADERLGEVQHTRRLSDMPFSFNLPQNHSCKDTLWSALLELIPGVKDVRHFQAPYLDLATGKVIKECPPWSDVFRHVFTFKWTLALLGDGWLFQHVLLRMNAKYESWDIPFRQQGQDPETEVLKFCREWGVKLEPYMWDKTLDNYTTANEFFTRKYASKYAPENNLANTSIVAPTDSIVTWYESAQLLPKLLKNEEWTLDAVGIPNHTEYLPFPAAIMYLAPYDYHCYHAPITGRLTKADMLNQHRWSLTVKSYIYKTANILRRNRRAVLIMQSEDDPSLSVAMVVVGGVTVDSIRLQPYVKAGARVQKGQLLGCFARGGSTVALLFSGGVQPHEPQPANAIKSGLSFRVKAAEALGNVGKRPFAILQ